MNNVKEKLDIWQKVWLIMPVAIWFSYYPLMGLGQDDTMNFKLSITMIYMAVLAVVGIPIILRKWRTLIKNRAVLFATVFVGWNGVSLLWTTNLTRGILTCGMIGIVYLIFLSMIAEREKILKILPALIKILTITTVVMCVLAWVQMVAGIWLGQNETFLCSGCVAVQFGFVRPNAFAIEPQFFGNILLAPALILLWRIMKKQGNWRTNLVFIFVAATLILTLSRGAIFAFGAGVIILFICIRALKPVLLGLSFAAIGVFVALFMQGITAEINPNHDETFGGAVTKSIHQLSMGVIDLRAKNPAPSAPKDDVETTIAEPESTTNFDGYVAESTDTRLELSRLAIATWAQKPSTILFGVGIGGSGVAMHETFLDQRAAREIVQNEFVEILLENGVVGAAIFLCIIIGLFYKTRRKKWTWAIIAAFLIQWNFFSGYPSALHIYPILAMILLCAAADQNLPKRAP